MKQLAELGLIRKDYSCRENCYGIRQQTSNTCSVLPLPDCNENGEAQYVRDEELPL